MPETSSSQPPISWSGPAEWRNERAKHIDNIFRSIQNMTQKDQTSTFFSVFCQQISIDDKILLAPLIWDEMRHMKTEFHSPDSISDCKAFHDYEKLLNRVLERLISKPNWTVDLLSTVDDVSEVRTNNDEIITKNRLFLKILKGIIRQYEMQTFFTLEGAKIPSYFQQQQRKFSEKFLFAILRPPSELFPTIYPQMHQPMLVFFKESREEGRDTVTQYQEDAGMVKISSTDSDIERCIFVDKV